METNNEGDGNDEKADGAVESTKPRVRLPVMTQGIINPVAITQLQDELEDTKKKLDRLQATRMLSEDEMILPKRMRLSRLIGVFPIVRDQINFRTNQRLNNVCEEYETKIKRSKDEHHDKHLRDMAIVREMESKLFKAEERLDSVGMIARVHPNAPVGEVWSKIQNGTYDPLKKGPVEPKPIYKSGRNTQPQASRTMTSDTLTSNDPFRNNRWANSDGRKREYDEPANGESSEGSKRSKTA
ncbi:predicted protein [Sclerotinia sclerotiorum 1980 UF-70]|uniref:Uncharacterized protein n=2 Tax=Sclerotinia sclerotiorum (strain ATCC 18683 / 1980 / Ss-1) TaxID=665079 RepID=A7EZB9_SCLS1|nr:predicted protein [Sclerotinia sclerotiorum 1980 UF-70]APA12297.1 hypothetical protein sscle_09g070670 [Sclerotinia sclerotiorum 1980 UF-70]EDN94811.1 predicted protein [Sclerotinia sclerotiorum 1980 UF-70]